MTPGQQEVRTQRRKAVVEKVINCLIFLLAMWMLLG